MTNIFAASHFRYVISAPLCIIACGIAHGASYRGTNLTYEYPTGFHEMRINNAPHMLCKIGNGKYIISVSEWEYSEPIQLNVWSDEYQERAKSISTRDGSRFVKMDKSTIPSGEKCLKVFANKSTAHGELKILTYVVVDNGNLYVFCVISQGSYSQRSIGQEEHSFFTGLRFRSPVSTSTTPSQPSTAYDPPQHHYHPHWTQSLHFLWLGY